MPARKGGQDGLAPRERVLLMMIAENTDVDREPGGSGDIYQFFHGDAHANTAFFVEFQAEPVYLWDQGDRACLESLLQAGLIARTAPDAWNFVATQKGEALAEVLRARPREGKKRRGRKQAEAGEGGTCTT